MVLTEMITKSSSEFFECIPERHHKMLIEYIDMIPEFRSALPTFIRATSPELIRSNLILNGFNPFDAENLIHSFYQHCIDNDKECRRLIETGFLEDIREFLVEFLQGL